MLTDENRRRIWMSALSESLMVALKAAFQPQSVDIVSVNAIVSLREATKSEMDDATDDTMRDTCYERHRALSAMIDEIQSAQRIERDEQARRQPAKEE